MSPTKNFNTNKAKDDVIELVLGGGDLEAAVDLVLNIQREELGIKEEVPRGIRTNVLKRAETGLKDHQQSRNKQNEEHSGRSAMSGLLRDAGVPAGEQAGDIAGMKGTPKNTLEATHVKKTYWISQENFKFMKENIREREYSVFVNAALEHYRKSKGL